MQISRELIERFFDKRCTEEEAKQVSAYLRREPAVLEEYLSEQEWEDVIITERKPEVFWEEVWLGLQRRKRQVIRRMWVRRVSAAAAILLLLGGGIYWLYRPGVSVVVPMASREVILSNTEGRMMEVLLEDSTEVALSPSSVLRYRHPFGDRRMISVEGEAIFEVAKDERPFIVNSNDIATTALGTRFRVMSFSAHTTIRVQLYTGKVVVRPAEQVGTVAGLREQYLRPGETLIYDKQLKTTKIISIRPPATTVNNAAIATGRSRTVPSWYMFNKASLASVFDQLSEMYGTPVLYASHDVEQLYFIGRFEQTDSLKNILTTICELNNLKLEQRSNGGYKVSK